MTREELIRIAGEVGAYRYANRYLKYEPTHTFIVEKLERFAELVAAEYKRDAERYRWLREQNSTLEDRTFYVGIDDRSEPEGIMWVGSDLDAAIDAAIVARGERK